VRVGYSRISDERQAGTDPLQQARHELEKAGCELILVEVGSGTSDADRPRFRQLRDMVLDGQVSEIVTPSQDRLGRNLRLVEDFVQLCHIQKVKLTDLNGRELEVRSADGTLMTQLLGALDQHRSSLYAEKTRRHLKAAREQGMPCLPGKHLAFGLRKVRNESGRFVAIELDPVTAPLARQRIDWFLGGMSLTAICLRIEKEQPAYKIQMRQLQRWLRSPFLTGRIGRVKDEHGNFTQVDAEQTFQALISDVEAEAIRVRLEAGVTLRGLRDRPARMFTGLVRCSCCGRNLVYKVSGRATTYLRCALIGCERRGRMIREDKLFAVLQYALPEHARALVPLLTKPAVDPPEVAALQAEIEVLRGIAGTDAVVEAKRAEINRLRTSDAATPGWLLVGALRSPTFWLQDDGKLNNVLRLLLERVVVDLGPTVAASRVAAVRCRTSPAEAPLPPDQDSVLLERGLADLVLAAHHQERVDAALASL
jgi:DNA invertase Pin-like site-specific DNA recombinase